VLRPRPAWYLQAEKLRTFRACLTASSNARSSFALTLGTRGFQTTAISPNRPANQPRTSALAQPTPPNPLDRCRRNRKIVLNLLDRRRMGRLRRNPGRQRRIIDPRGNRLAPARPNSLPERVSRNRRRTSTNLLPSQQRLRQAYARSRAHRRPRRRCRRRHSTQRRSLMPEEKKQERQKRDRRSLSRGFIDRFECKRLVNNNYEPGALPAIPAKHGDRMRMARFR
jgi:hypothetical protein